MDPDERPDSHMNPAAVKGDSDDESDTSEVLATEDDIQQALDLLAKDPTGENLTAFQQLGKARLPANLQLKTLGGPLFFTDLYKSNGWRVQQHKVTSLCRVLDPSNTRVAWGSKGALRKTFVALLQLKGLSTVAGAPKEHPIDLVAIPEDDLPKFQERVADMERGVRHPLGNDTFETNHGADYFAFFRRMGRVYCFVGLHEGRVVALANGVLRPLKYHADKPERPVWRLGDLKVRPEYRGQGLTLRMLRTFVPDLYSQGTRAYLVSMNPGDGSPNHVVHIMNKIPFKPFRQGPNLLFYSLSKEEMATALEALTLHRGPVSFLSLQGVKDIVLTSTGQPLPLLHAQFGACAAKGQFTEPQEGHRHMFCVPEGDPLCAALAQFPVAATASTMHHGLGRTSWQWVLTSEV